MPDTTHAPIEAGMAAPEFEGFDEQGHRHRLSEYGGSTLILCFFPHPGSVPSGRDLSDSFPGARRKDAFLLGVMSGDAQTLGRFRARHLVPFPLLCDGAGRIAAAYGVDGSHRARFAIFAIGADGKVEGVYKNLDNPRHLNELLRRA